MAIIVVSMKRPTVERLLAVAGDELIGLVLELVERLERLEAEFE